MNRRDMILTTAAATVTASTGAASQNRFEMAEPRAASPIIIAARRWRDHYEWINDTDLTEDETNAAVNQLSLIERDMLALEPADDRDLLVQLMITTTMWEGVGELYGDGFNAPALRARCAAFKERVL